MTPSQASRRGPWQPWMILVLAIVGLAAFLRFDGLGEPSLWLDEILHVEMARQAAAEPWHNWLTGVSADRENGSLYYASQLLAQRLVDDGEVGVRLMPALAGLAAVVAIFFAGFAATGRVAAGALAATLLAVSPLHVYYSREGRPYAAVMLLAMLLLLLALLPKRRGTVVAVYGLCLGAAYWGAVAAPVLISCAGLAALEWLRTRRSAHFVVAAVAGLGIAWLLFPEIQHLSGSTVATGKYVAQWDVTKPMSGLAFDRLLASLSVSGVDRGTSTGLSWLFLALALWGAISLLRRDVSKAAWVVGMCVLPILGSLAVLVLWQHWYNVRYTSAGLPAFLLLVGVGLMDLVERWFLPKAGTNIPQRRRQLTWLPNAAMAVAVLLLVAPTWQAARAEPLQKPDWRGTAQLITSLATAEEPVITRDRWSETCIGYYLNHLEAPIEVLFANYELAQAEQLISRFPSAWVLSAGYRKTPEFEAWMHSLDPVVRSQLANLRLSFYPDFATLLAQPGRGEGLAALSAARQQPTTRQEFADDELMLGAGWAFPERDPQGMSFRWAIAERAEIALLTPKQSGPQQLHLRLMPFPSPDRPPQRVTVAVNSQPLREVTLEPGWNEISLPLTVDSTVAWVTFDFAWRQSPSDLDPNSGDPRLLAAAFDFAEMTVASP